MARVPLSAFGPADSSGARYVVATIRTINPAFPQWLKPVKVTLRDRDGVIDVVGIDRGGAASRVVLHEQLGAAMAFLLALALWLFRVTGFLTEPMLTSDEIHAVAGEPSRTVWPLAPDRPLRIVTWNIERGVKFEAVQSVLQELDADVVLLQEVDRFCARSDDRDVARELALHLRMNYVTAGEFQEIGEGRRDRPCVSGQAILSRLPIADATTVRFEDQATLKWRLNPAQPRRGGRIALARANRRRAVLQRAPRERRRRGAAGESGRATSWRTCRRATSR